MRAAIVGPGRAGNEHIKAYLAYGVEITAVCGRTKESAEQKISELGLRAAVYDNFDQMLDKEKIDVISICSPPEFHAEQTIKAALKGIHIAIEKPVAVCKEELVAMREIINRSGVKTIVGFVLRWNDLVQNIKRQYLEKIGNIFYLETDYWHGSSHEKKRRLHEYGTRTYPLGAFIGGGCHAVDMARFLANSDIKEVAALTPYMQAQQLQRTTVAIVKFKNGIIGKISATDEVFMPYVFNISIFGNDGAIRLNQIYSKHSAIKQWEIIPGAVPDSGAVWHHPFRGMISEFIDCIIQNRQTSCNFENSINTHLACFAAEESARRGGEKIWIQ